jgi:hypothetical protein
MNEKKKSAEALPPGVKPDDLKWPKMEKHLGYKELDELGLKSPSLLFYLCEGRNDFGWVLTTLRIGGGRNGRSDRYYGVEVAGFIPGRPAKVVRVGDGPHVTKKLTVHLSKDNIERLRHYVELYQAGLGDAGDIRDRISSRRAQGQLHRAQGHTHWHW